MTDPKKFIAGQNPSIRAPYGDMFERHRTTVRAQKGPMAIAKLARAVTCLLMVSNRKGSRR